MNFNDWLWPLAACIRVQYDKATFESLLSPPRQISLQGVTIDEYRSGRPEPGKCICQRKARFTVEIEQGVSREPIWDGIFPVAPGQSRDRLSRLFCEVQKDPALFGEICVNDAIWEAYDRNGCDEGHFAQIVKRFAESDHRIQDEYERFKVILSRLPLADQDWYAEIAAEESEGFSAVMGVVLQSITSSVGGTSLALIGEVLEE